MRKAKVDSNQPVITKALRAAGCSVQPLHTVGRGVPDLLVGKDGQNFLLEVKDGDKRPSERKLTDDQRDWHQQWRGQVAVVETVADALRIIEPEKKEL